MAHGYWQGHCALKLDPHHGLHRESRAKAGTDHPATADIVDTAIAAGDFELLVKLLKVAKLDGLLKGDGSYTVFAPTDEAFAGLPEGAFQALLDDPVALASVLKRHVLRGEVSAASLLTHDQVATAAGSNVETRSISVVRADIHTGNGIIHVVDQVIVD